MATPAAQKPVPPPTDITKEFWAATEDEKLLLQDDGGRAQFYPRPSATADGKTLAWREAKGTGTLVAITTCRVPGPGFEAPYLVGIVQLDEGPRVFATVVNAQPGDVSPGQKMRMTWTASGGPMKLYAFEPAPTS